MTRHKMPSQKRPTIAIAGASGFIGTVVCREFSKDYDIIALTRSPARSETAHPQLPITWCHCDLFSANEVEVALRGADYAIYLVHSMLPSARLTQAKPEDMDLLIADNFARAAQRNGLKQILYVGAIVTDSFEISRLLWSRREVEMMLASHDTPTTSLRADLVVGPGGSALKMLVKLVQRMPVMPLPRAARSKTQPIALQDLMRALRFCLGNPETHNRHFDIGGPQPLTYRTILQQTAEVLGKRLPMFTLPLVPMRLVALFAKLISGAPAALVRPLIESLSQNTPVKDNIVQRAILPEAIPYREALIGSLDDARRSVRPSPRLVQREKDDLAIKDASVVRSIQRLILPPGEDAAWVSGNYFRWLPRFCWPFVACHFDEIGSCSVAVRFPPIHILTLTLVPEQSTPDRQLYFITGGLLLRKGQNLQGRFEFRDVLGGRFTIAAIHDFAPWLPWYIYNLTQAPIHLLVMRAYQRRLARLAR